MSGSGPARPSAHTRTHTHRKEQKRFWDGMQGICNGIQWNYFITLHVLSSVLRAKIDSNIIILSLQALGETRDHNTIYFNVSPEYKYM